jgi:asparagine synthase (glutamine-hydrolysing)
MCGVFGIIARHDVHADLERPLERLRHRGPDDVGAVYWRPTEPVRVDQPGPCRVALGHRRLSIIDPSPAGHQPMGTADGRWWLVFNGEVYNYLELRAELEASGCSFRSRTDTEVVLTALATWGPERALPRFKGMFALVLLDALDQTILIARDPFGIKPLYLCQWRDGVAFSSEIPPILDLPGVGLEMDAERVWHYLRYGVSDHGEGTFLRAVRQLPPASWCRALIGGKGGFGSPQTYWHPNDAPSRGICFHEAAERFRSVFLDSVRLHLRSDVPLGSALSGGLDSAAIVCAIRHLEPSSEIHTFSFLPDDHRISEKRWVDIVNQHVGAIAHPVKILPDELATDLDWLMESQGEPFSSTSMYAQHRVFRTAREAGIIVMLDGQGADEQLGGYPWHQGYQLAGLLRQRQWVDSISLARSQFHWTGRSASTVMAWALNALLPRWVLPTARAAAGRTDWPAWIRWSWFQERGVDGRYPFRPVDDPNTLRQNLQYETYVSVLPRLLRYEDRNSMAWSVESRVPFLTTDLADFLGTLPEDYIIGSDGSSKRVMRAALRGIVPDAILDRRDKIGFATPERSWLAERPDLIASAVEIAPSIPFFDPPGVVDFCRRVAEGGQGSTEQVWRLINFSLWYRRIQNNSRVQPTPT